MKSIRSILLSTLVLIVLFTGCLPENYLENNDPEVEEKAEDLYRLALAESKKLNINLDINLDDVRLELYKNREILPCESDYNRDGVVSTLDLLILLSGLGEVYTTQDLLKLLASYEAEYERYFHPGIANFAHIKCNGGWDAVPRIYCGDRFLSYDGDELIYKWYDQDTVLIQDGGSQLEFQTYMGLDPVDQCSGWTPPFNGINTAYLQIEAPDGRIYFNGGLGWVTSVSWGPVIGPITGTFMDVENLFYSSGNPTEFCLNCVD